LPHLPPQKQRTYKPNKGLTNQTKILKGDTSIPTQHHTAYASQRTALTHIPKQKYLQNRFPAPRHLSTITPIAHPNTTSTTFTHTPTEKIPKTIVLLKQYHQHHKTPAYCLTQLYLVVSDLAPYSTNSPRPLQKPSSISYQYIYFKSLTIPYKSHYIINSTTTMQNPPCCFQHWRSPIPTIG
jgi:hypothetical protein